jgi:hypothetical protein
VQDDNARVPKVKSTILVILGVHFTVARLSDGHFARQLPEDEDAVD